jgi:hypothetical protein
MASAGGALLAGVALAGVALSDMSLFRLQKGGGFVLAALAALIAAEGGGIKGVSFNPT